MKKILSLFLLVAISFVAQAKKVKFAVDMDTFAISPNGVHVTGDFQALAGYPGGDWTSNETVCAQEGATTIYSVVVDIPAFAKYEYKFVNGDQFYEVEFVPIESRIGYDFNDNRWIWVDSLGNDTTFVGAIKFAGNAPAGLNLVRFLVNLTNEAVISTLPHVYGNFQNWNPLSTSLYSFGDSVYEIIAYVPSGNYEYKFINGSTVGLAETVPFSCNVNGSRGVAVSKDTVLDIFCFATCNSCNPLAMVHTNTNSNVKMYPNPMHNMLTIQLPDNFKAYTILITDIAGREIQSYTASNNLIIQNSSMHRGMYLVKILDDKKIYSTEKLLVE
ncbi:MAG TPA: T9SS type A sorting domain-containing protein [Bacteroidia bacterium]|nr:T9SS type A sorting domain-containing protein [Bacteroidia bacterium]HRH07423.1 T9SS type A sorting domain-containing protein [Bacteroidia bacterium]